MRKTLSSILMILLSVYGLTAATISGVVSNQNNGQPIEYANAIIKETQQGAYTNNRGYFVITNVTPGEYTLFFTQISFAVQQKPISITYPEQNEYLKIELKPQAVTMQEINVVNNTNDLEINTRDIKIGNINRTTKQLLDVVQVAEPDVFRSMLTLPGVTPIADFSSGLYVRGGTPDQNQILLDEIDVYNPTHFGGLFSTFNTDAINNVELLKGGFPAKHGGRLSSVLNVQNRDGNRKSHHGVARVSLLSMSGTLEGPWKLGEQSGSYMASYRRSYLELMQKMIDVIPDYYFYDGHAKAVWDVGQKDILMFSTYFGRDRLDMDLGMKLHIDWGNSVFSSQWIHVFSPQLFSQFVLASSHFDSQMGQQSGDSELKRVNALDDGTLKGILSYKPNNDHLLEFGFETKINEVDFHIDGDAGWDSDRMINLDTKSLISDLYLQDSWDIDTFWTLQPGARLSWYKTLTGNLKHIPDANYARLSPRVSLRRKLSVDSNVYASFGRYYQFCNVAGMEISSPFDIWVPLDGTIKPGEADHYILGYKHELMEGLGLDIELYYKKMRHLTEYNIDNEQDWSNSSGTVSDVFNKGEGDAKGLDILLRTDIWGLSGFVGYSLGISRKKIENTNTHPITHEPQYYYPKHDRTHQLNIVEAWNISESTGKQLWGADMILGITYAYATGQPTSVPERVYIGDDHISQMTFLYSYRDRERLPAYSRLDLSYKMLWENKKWSIEPYVQVINVTDRQNVYSRNYYVTNVSQDPYNPQFKLEYADSYQFPLIPFVGVNIVW